MHYDLTTKKIVDACKNAYDLLIETGDNHVKIFIDQRGVHIMRDNYFVPSKMMDKKQTRNLLDKFYKE